MKPLFATTVLLFVISSSPGADPIEAGESAPSGKTHLGDCILLAPAAEVPRNLYQESDVTATNEYQPFTKKLTVYGITLIGRDDISDDFMRRVAKTVKEMFPQLGDIDRELQKQIIGNMYRYRTVIPMFKGDDHEFTPEDEAAWDLTRSRNSVCDIIMEGVDGQAMEVVEHILHFVSDIGLHYALPDDWGISKTSRLYQAMQEAIDKGYYDIQQYGDTDNEERNRVLLQEFAYWIITSAWNLQEPYGPDAEWKTIRTASDLKQRLPAAHALIQRTLSKVLTSPSRSTLDGFKTKNR